MLPGTCKRRHLTSSYKYRNLRCGGRTNSWSLASVSTIGVSIMVREYLHFKMALVIINEWTSNPPCWVGDDCDILPCSNPTSSPFTSSTSHLPVPACQTVHPGLWNQLRYDDYHSWCIPLPYTSQQCCAFFINTLYTRIYFAIQGFLYVY